MRYPETAVDRAPDGTTRPTSSTRRRRIIGIVAAASLAVSSVAMINTPPSSAATEVPEVAQLAGDLADQELNWETCDFGDPDLNDQLNGPDVKCATVTVPRDWHNPDNGKTWDIRISQAHNIDVDDPRYQGTLFGNPGGPGGSGLIYGPALQMMTPDLNPYYNYVGFDPRGVGQSSQAECEYSWDPASDDPYAELKAAGEACSTNEDVTTINTEQTTYDMDFIRHLLDAPKLSYIGYSYGTWLGTWYENVFGAKYGDKFLLDSSIDTTEPTLEETWNLQPIARDRQFEQRMLHWIARHDADYGLGEDPQEIERRYFDATAKLDPGAVVLTWVLLGGIGAFGYNADYPLAGTVVQVLIEQGEQVDQQAAKTADKAPADAADALLTKIADTADGDVQAKAEQAQKRIAPLKSLQSKEEQQKSARSSDQRAAQQTATLNDPFEFIRCNDGQWTQGDRYWDKHNAKLAKKAPLTNQFGLLTVPICAYWQTENLMPVADENSFPDTVIVQSEMDSQTGWEGGRRAGTKLPNTSFVAIDNEGTHGAFPYGTEAVDRPIIDFFLDGEQPKNIKVTQALPLPNDDQAYQNWAKLNRRAKHRRRCGLTVGAGQDRRRDPGQHAGQGTPGRSEHGCDAPAAGPTDLRCRRHRRAGGCRSSLIRSDQGSGTAGRRRRHPRFRRRRPGRSAHPPSESRCRIGLRRRPRPVRSG